MDKTLFTPPMIETFRVCRKAYQLAFASGTAKIESRRPGSVCKRFILRALAEINRGRVTTVNQVQKFMGMHWTVEKLPADDVVKAFLFAYKALTNYVSHPYRPQGSQVVGVSLKVRARVPHERIYLEDHFDLVLWHPAERKLEFVDYHLAPLKAFNEAWPSASILVKQFLAERLRCRWPYEKLALTFCRVGTHGVSPTSYELDDTLFRLHWPELLKTLEEMKSPDHYEAHESSPCPRCQFLQNCLTTGQAKESVPAARTA